MRACLRWFTLAIYICKTCSAHKHKRSNGNTKPGVTRRHTMCRLSTPSNNKHNTSRHIQDNGYLHRCTELLRTTTVTDKLLRWIHDAAVRVVARTDVPLNRRHSCDSRLYVRLNRTHHCRASRSPSMSSLLSEVAPGASLPGKRVVMCVTRYRNRIAVIVWTAPVAKCVLLR